MLCSRPPGGGAAAAAEASELVTPAELAALDAEIGRTSSIRSETVILLTLSPIPIETPNKGKGGGGQQNDSLADGYFDQVGDGCRYLLVRHLLVQRPPTPTPKPTASVSNHCTRVLTGALGSAW